MKNFYCKHHVWLNGAILIAAAFAVFSNNYRHDYPLDCSHLLLDNPYVRSLKYVPRYFADPSTLTVLPANTDYRPVLQTTYALNYAISRYDTWSWHLLQILLHVVCGMSLYFLCRRIIREFHPEAGTLQAIFVSLAAGLLFVVHPTASGVVNYLSARSSLLTAAFLLPSITLYLRPVYHGNKAALPAAPSILYALALFTKIEAIGALAVYFLCDALLIAKQRLAGAEGAEKNRGTFLSDMLAAFKCVAFKKLWLFAVITVVYLVIYAKVMSGYHEAARHASDVTPLVYLFTQVTAWWHYVFNWFAPVNLVADDLSYPVFRSLFAPEVLLAIAGGLLAVGLLLRLYPRYPYLIFLAASALALISPTSSFMPLAEMVNEHRPYLPMALLSLTWLLPAGLLAPAAAQRFRPPAMIAAAGFALLVVAFFTLTFQRNRVFSSEKSYYLDIIQKAPSSRAYVNYGLTLMREGRYDEALKYCRSALELAPNWHIVHINLGILYQRRGDMRQAQYHFDRAVETEQYSAYGLAYRAEFRLAQRMYAPALDDLEKCLPMTREFFRVYKDMATAAAGLGEWEKSLEYTRKCFAIDPVASELEIVGISRPFWDGPDRYAAGIGYYQGIASLYPARWWVFQNIGDLAGKTGQPELAQKSFEQAARLRQEDSLRKAGGVLGK